MLLPRQLTADCCVFCTLLVSSDGPCELQWTGVNDSTMSDKRIRCMHLSAFSTHLRSAEVTSLGSR